MSAKDVEKYCPDLLWEIAEPLVPEPPRRHQGGGRRRTVGPRQVLAALIYMARAGCSWRELPVAMFGVTRPTGHRRLTQWTEAGFFDRLHQAILDRLGRSGQLRWERAAIDSMSVRAKRGVN